MDIYDYSRKDIGNLGETVACEYLRRQGFAIKERNAAFKTGELDIVAQKGDRLHIVEVKSLACEAFPNSKHSGYRPEENLHQAKLRKLIRTSEWYVLRVGWEGEWQLDAAIVWLRKSDGRARIHYIQQIV